MIGQRIKIARNVKSISQQELAKKLGLKTQSIQQWESGRTAPRYKRIEQLAQILEVSASWLYGVTGKADAITPQAAELNFEEYRELSTEASKKALAKLFEIGWIQLNRTDVSVEAIGDLLAHEIKHAFNQIKQIQDK